MELHLLLAIVLVSARAGAIVAGRAGAPAVLGEMLAGIVLGPAVLDVVALPETEGTAGPLYGLAQIGLCALLFRVGLETDLDRLQRILLRSSVLAGAGFVLPGALGTASALALGVPPLAAVFLGAGLTATSIGVTASVLAELGKGGGRVAALVLGAAVIDDVLGLLLLAALVGIGTGGSAVLLPIVQAMLAAGILLALAFGLGGPLARATVWITQRSGERSTLLVVVFAALLLTAAGARAAGLEMIIGAYALGVALARHRERAWIEAELRPVIDLFTPIFFVLVGSSIAWDALDVGSPAGRSTITLTVALLAAALTGKLLAPMVLREREASTWVIGSALVPRGEVGLVFAQIGLRQGALTTEQFSALAVVIGATTFAGPLLLRRLWP